MFKNNPIFQTFVFVVLLAFTLQTELYSAQTSSSLKQLSNNLKISVKYGDIAIEKKFPQEHIEKMFQTALTKKEFYKKDGRYLLNINVEELTSLSTKSSTEASSSVRYNLVDTDTNTSLSTTTLAIPHREFNYSKLPQKDVETFTMEKSLQANIDKYMETYLTPANNSSIEELSKDKTLDQWYGFVGVGFAQTVFTSDEKQKSLKYKLGAIWDGSQRFALEYQDYKKKESIKRESFTLNYDYIFFADKMFKPYLGFHAGKIYSKNLMTNTKTNDYIYGLQTGLIVDLVKYIELEMSLAVDTARTEPEMINREFTACAGLNLKF